MAHLQFEEGKNRPGKLRNSHIQEASVNTPSNTYCDLFCIVLHTASFAMRQRSVIEFLINKALENISKPIVQQWLKVVAPNDNNALHNYICLSAVAYRRKPRHDGLPILTSIIQQLVKLGFDVNAPNSYGETALFLAGANSDLISVETLIKLGADVNAKCCVLLETILHQACLSERHLMMETLLQVPGIAVSALNMHGWTPLHLAAQRGDVYKVRRLLEAGADVTIQSKRGDTPLFFSVQKKAGDVSDSAFSFIFDFIKNTMDAEKAEAMFLHVDKKGTQGNGKRKANNRNE
ncbi:ankyrin repeat and SOCS box protein 2-like [Bolinopsis microptera]|uniref:ankyrin repeat and SOCS box protein 2-like n=1 Tax=Bolinopsis microptera TaxID=2820187 RepID=UPI003078EF97